MSLDNLTCGCNHGDTEEEKYARIAQVIDAYKDKEGSLIMILHAAQEIYGYLPLELQKFIALRMGIPLSKVYGVVGFYSFFPPKNVENIPFIFVWVPLAMCAVLPSWSRPLRIDCTSRSVALLPTRNLHWMWHAASVHAGWHLPSWWMMMCINR